MKPTRLEINRIFILIGLMILSGLIIVTRLFYFQIIKNPYYKAIATQEHLGYQTLPARRGEILAKDYHSGETFKLATNITLDLLYADPTLIKNKQLVSDTLAPIIFDLEEERKLDKEHIQKAFRFAETEEQKEKIKPKTDEELFENFKNNLLAKISQEIRETILLQTNLSEEAITAVKEFGLDGIIIENNNLYAKPLEIKDKSYTARLLSPFLDIETDQLEKILIGRNRYIILKKKLQPEISTQIKEIIRNDKTSDFFGVRLQEEYYRFYPEKTLAAQILGFVDHNKIGQYGVESTFNTQLQGREGIFSSKRDASGNLITVGDSIIQPPQDGDNIVLTIDRSIQLEIERKLKKAVEDYRAISGQVVIIDPQTGRITAMANHPTFDPNEYGNVFEKEEIFLSEEDKQKLVTKKDEFGERYYLYYNEEIDDKVEIFKEKIKEDEIIYKKYINRVGPAVYRNQIISGLYEPGSVFKAIAMAAAINDGDVTPNTTYNDTGPIKVDEYEIHTSDDKYHGIETMTEVLENSCNTGMAFVARKLGRTLFYNYMQLFGFGQRTDIELDNEHPGQIEYPDLWAESELVTHAFGQGIGATPLQMVTAMTVIANNGILMQPFIIDSIQKESGQIETNEPEIIHRVITKKSADIMTHMLVSTIENGVAWRAKTPNHYVAGKTGTSQTYKHGKPLTGAGTTITSFSGYGPIDNPKFVILIKLDQPKTSVWGSETAAPLFSEIATFLFQYYNIPPDKE